MPLDLVPLTAAGLATGKTGLRDSKKVCFIMVLPLRDCERLEVFGTKGTCEAVCHGGVVLIRTRRFGQFEGAGISYWSRGR